MLILIMALFTMELKHSQSNTNPRQQEQCKEIFSYFVSDSAPKKCRIYCVNSCGIGVGGAVALALCGSCVAIGARLVHTI